MRDPAKRIEISACTDASEMRDYLEQHWKAGHILARDPAMFDFTYSTPWVERTAFPGGISVLVARSAAGKLVGFLGAIVAPYPRPVSFWLAMWHVLDEVRGTGTGFRLHEEMNRLLPEGDGWIGAFGVSDSAFPVHLKRGLAARAVRRFIYSPDTREPRSPKLARHSAELDPDDVWLDFRFRRHPVFEYEVRPGGVFRTETNAWGRVTHVVRLGEEPDDDLEAVYAREAARAERDGQSYVMDLWDFDSPGGRWALADNDLPSVFHPPAARGNMRVGFGKPFLPTHMFKGDSDQDRPN